MAGHLGPLKRLTRPLIDNQFLIELPYYNTLDNYQTSNPEAYTKSVSYGILCVSRDGYIVLNKSPPYVKTYLNDGRKNKNKKLLNPIRLDNLIVNAGLRVNTNEKYNLLLSSFSHATLEGEYTLPKGKMDVMDEKRSIFTKVREFIEETKHTHPLFPALLNEHYRDPNFQSFLNDENFILRESWLGLDNRVYHCEYSVLVIDAITELIPVSSSHSVVPFKYFLTHFDIYKNCKKYYKKYRRGSNLDRQKVTLFLPIVTAVNLLNQHKLNLYASLYQRQRLRLDSRLRVCDIYPFLLNLK